MPPRTQCNILQQTTEQVQHTQTCLTGGAESRLLGRAWGPACVAVAAAVYAGVSLCRV